MIRLWSEINRSIHHSVIVFFFNKKRWSSQLLRIRIIHFYLSPWSFRPGPTEKKCVTVITITNERHRVSPRVSTSPNAFVVPSPWDLGRQVLILHFIHSFIIWLIDWFYWPYRSFAYFRISQSATLLVF